MANAISILKKFNLVSGKGDVEGMISLMTKDCLFDNTYPAPDGSKMRGHAAIKAYFTEFYSKDQEKSFVVEEIVVLGNRVVQRWKYSWIDDNGKAGHVRGIDLIKIRNGKISEKLAYVKG